MIARIVSTAVLVLLSAGGFAQAIFATIGDGSVFLVFGVLWLGLAVANWFTWRTLREGWACGRDAVRSGPELPLSGWFWPDYFKGMLRVLGAPDSDRSGAASCKRDDQRNR